MEAMRRPCLLVVLVVTMTYALLASAVPSSSAQQASPQTSPTPRFTTTVTVDGRRLGLTCAGSGSPTVVLVGGIKRPAEVIWPVIFDAISPLTRVCAFDRAGVGPSDPQPHTSQTAADVVADLHGALAAAGETGPYVLVGFSVSGLFVRLYASTYPDEMAGLVLVEGSPPGIYGPFAANDPGTEAPIDLFVSESQVVVAPPPPPMPMVNILAEKFDPTYAPGTPGTWFALQARQAKDLGARTVTAKESGHLVPLDQPQVVVTAIADVVAAVRDPSRWATPAATPVP
jgi:pimeloyl-ACP methyl ester carboxylesterase